MAEEPTPPRERSEFRERLWEIIFEAETPTGKAFDVMLLWAIVLSVLAVMLESIPAVAEKWVTELHVIEWFFTIVFMLEYALRIYLVRRPSRYIFSFFGIIDLLSWIPTFLAIFVLGMALAYVYERTGTLTAPIVFHSVFNGWTFLGEVVL